MPRALRTDGTWPMTAPLDLGGQKITGIQGDQGIQGLQGEQGVAGGLPSTWPSGTWATMEPSNLSNPEDCLLRMAAVLSLNGTVPIP